MTLRLPPHHMYLIEGTRDTARELLTQLGYTAAHQRGDVWEREVDLLTIEIAHEMRAAAHLAAHGERKFLLLAAQRLGPEAQQALLKLSEEPPARTIIALVVPSVYLCMPTLRSRAVIVRSGSEPSSPEDEEFLRDLAHTYLTASTAAQRRELLETLIKRDDAPSTFKRFLRYIAHQATHWPTASQRLLRDMLVWLEAPAPHIKGIASLLTYLPTETHCNK